MAKGASGGPCLFGRRAFIAGAVLGSSASAARPLLAPKIAAIRWPGPVGDLHGYMAVPAEARGPQPAVLVIPDTSGADRFALGLVDALAVAGMVACLPKALSSLQDGVTTARWLATNRYSTGRVAAIGLGWGGDLTLRMAASPGSMLIACVTFGASASVGSTVAALRLPAIGTLAGSDYDAAWQRTLSFLKEHLA
jgi:dienelactone hydrolase